MVWIPQENVTTEWNNLWKIKTENFGGLNKY